MTLDDGTAITLATGIIVALAGTVAWLWKAMDARYQSELSKRDAEIKDLVDRVRKLEDDRVPTQQQHAEKIAALTDRYDSTSEHVAQALASVSKAVREIAQNVNAHTDAIRSMRCKNFEQSGTELPEAHPAAKQGTDALTKRDPPTAPHSPADRRWRTPT